MIGVYREVVAHAVQWKCHKERRVMPKSNSELYNNNLREVKHSTSRNSKTPSQHYTRV